MTITSELFRPHVGTPFIVQLHNGQQSALLLEEVKNNAEERAGHHSFSLFFHSDISFMLSQGTYCLRHTQLPELAIFLVPVSQTEQSYRYQACFNV
jgi:hypothetical protein